MWVILVGLFQRLAIVDQEIDSIGAQICRFLLLVFIKRQNGGLSYAQELINSPSGELSDEGAK
jgi:hypothetical protein